MVKSAVYNFLLTLMCLNAGLASAQPPEFTVLQGGLGQDDSSYYDVCRVESNEYWAIGKKGIITRFGTEGITGSVDHPNRGVDLLNMALLEKNTYLLCGDKGYVYRYKKLTGEWDVMQVKGYENACFYSICTVDEKLAFISGGRSKIAGSQRVVPFGFILKTSDGGKTWKRVYGSVTNMIWSVKYDKALNNIYALSYTPVNTKLLISSDHGETWHIMKKRIKGLFHDFKLKEGKLFLAGGKNGHFRKNGIIRAGEDIFRYPQTGIFWDVEVNANYALASSTGGNIIYKDHSGQWMLAHTPVDNNLYEIALVDEHSVFVVGNNKTILRIDFQLEK